MTSFWGCVVLVILVTGLLDQSEAGHGCPFNEAKCRSYCRNTEIFVSGYCSYFTCRCSNHCSRYGGSSAGCRSTCKKKGYRQWLCHHRDNLCYCGSH